jgi:hypothetical protein
MSLAGAASAKPHRPLNGWREPDQVGRFGARCLEALLRTVAASSWYMLGGGMTKPAEAAHRLFVRPHCLDGGAQKTGGQTDRPSKWED